MSVSIAAMWVIVMGVYVCSSFFVVMGSSVGSVVNRSRFLGWVVRCIRLELMVLYVVSMLVRSSSVHVLRRCLLVSGVLLRWVLSSWLIRLLVGSTWWRVICLVK